MPFIIAAERPDAPDAARLIAELDADLGAFGYPAESCHGYSIDKLVRENVAFFVTRTAQGEPVGCGGVQIFGDEYGELKRMYVRPAYRGAGLGRAMLAHLATYTRDRHIPLLRLETGIHQTAAIRLYESCGFTRRAPFGDYREDPLSVYFEKRLDRIIR